jgi:hypothetical protein
LETHGGRLPHQGFVVPQPPLPRLPRRSNDEPARPRRLTHARTAHAFEPTTANGQVWYFDYSRTMKCPDLHGNTSFVLFAEKNTLYVVVALIKSHSDIWDHAQALVDWVWTHLGIRISHLCGDSDPEWINSQPTSRKTKTARALAFEKKNGLTILVSPPYAHASTSPKAA